MRAVSVLRHGLMVLAVVLCSPFAAAEEPRPSYGPDVELAACRKIVAGALAEAGKNGWNVAVAVVDNHGFLVCFERMDDTQTASALIAVEKARTAATFRRPSAAFETALKGGRQAVLGLPGVTPVTGGLPIVRGGKIAGGVGVSGVASEQDEQCGKAGLEALRVN